MSIALDVSAVAVILLFAVIHAKRGFVRSVIGAVGVIAAVIAALLLSQPLADAVYDGFAASRVEAAVNGSVGEAPDSGQIADAAFSNGFISAGLRVSGVSRDQLVQKIDGLTSNGRQTVVNNVCDKIIAPAAVRLLSFLIGLIIVVLVIVAAKVIAWLADKGMDDTPVGRANAVFGCLLGIAEGVGAVFIAAAVLSLLIGLGEGSFLGVDRGVIDRTYLFKLLFDLV